jgi:hypothetical protein
MAFAFLSVIPGGNLLFSTPAAIRRTVSYRKNACLAEIGYIASSLLLL